MCGADVVGDVCFTCGYEIPAVQPQAEPEIPSAGTTYSNSYVPPPRVEVVDSDYRGNYYTEGKTFLHFCYKYNRMTTSQKFAKYWWLILLLLLLPAAICIVPAVMMYMMSGDREIRKFAGSLLMTGIVSLFVFA
jgi:hypothetical protein